MADLTESEANSIDTSGGPWESMYGAGTRLRNAELAITSLEAQVVRLLAEGTIDVPLTAFRIIASNDIPTLATAAGGVLANNSTPSLKRINGATNKCLQLRWASSATNVPITATVPLPENLDTSASLVVTARMGKSDSGTNQFTGTVDFITTFNETLTTTKTQTLTATVFATKTHTITAGAVPASAYCMTIELTPGSHTSTAILMTGCRVQYARTLT